MAQDILPPLETVFKDSCVSDRFQQDRSNATLADSSHFLSVEISNGKKVKNSLGGGVKNGILRHIAEFLEEFPELIRITLFQFARLSKQKLKIYVM